MKCTTRESYPQWNQKPKKTKISSKSASKSTPLIIKSKKEVDQIRTENTKDPSSTKISWNASPRPQKSWTRSPSKTTLSKPIFRTSKQDSSSAKSTRKSSSLNSPAKTPKRTLRLSQTHSITPTSIPTGTSIPGITSFSATRTRKGHSATDKKTRPLLHATTPSSTNLSTQITPHQRISRTSRTNKLRNSMGNSTENKKWSRSSPPTRENPKSHFFRLSSTWKSRKVGSISSTIIRSSRRAKESRFKGNSSKTSWVTSSRTSPS